jgi:hypothetical protein
LYFENKKYYTFIYNIPSLVSRPQMVPVYYRSRKLGTLQIATRYMGRRESVPFSVPYRFNSVAKWVGDVSDGPKMIPREWLIFVNDGVNNGICLDWLTGRRDE